MNTVNIDLVLKNNPIVDFLEQRGHEPVRKMGNNRYAYLCPLPGHKESKPSFIVFDGEPQSFWCFGCSKGHSIINLISYMDDISFSEALSRVSSGTEVNIQEDIKYLIDKAFSEKPRALKHLLAQELMDISCKLYRYSVSYPADVRFVDKLFGVLDKRIKTSDLLFVEKMNERLGPILSKRRKTKGD